MGRPEVSMNPARCVPIETRLRGILAVAALLLGGPGATWTPAAEPGPEARELVLRPARVFDGMEAEPHPGWIVVVHRDGTLEGGPEDRPRAPEGARSIDLP